MRRNAVTVRTQVYVLAVVVAVAVALLPTVPLVVVLRPLVGWADTRGGSEPDRG